MKNFDPNFNPDLTPKEMLELGVFCGKYWEKVPDDIPKSWFKNAKLAEGEGERDCSLNYFGVDASQPLAEWKRKGWISKHDPHGWFEWYCRYFQGRRIEDEDTRQIKRWNAFRRHLAQVAHNCRPGDFSCRPKQRQALLHWAYDSRKL